MSSPLNTVVPPPEEEPREIEEIISPVRPRKRNFILGEVVSFLSLLVAVFALGYVIYGHWPKFGQGIKVAHAPEATPQQDSPVVVVAKPVSKTPNLTVTDSAPVPLPRISSISTTTPNTGSVASAETETPHATGNVRTYKSTHGFTVQVPENARVEYSSSKNLYTFRSAAGIVLGQVAITDFLLDNTSQLAAQLSLSPDVVNISETTNSGYPGLLFTVRGVASAALVKSSRVYYVTDFSGTVIPGFHLR